jgi:hypothetical protein
MPALNARSKPVARHLVMTARFVHDDVHFRYEHLHTKIACHYYSG